MFSNRAPFETAGVLIVLAQLKYNTKTKKKRQNSRVCLWNVLVALFLFISVLFQLCGH